MAAPSASRRCASDLPPAPGLRATPHQNVADLKAQLAANARGIAELEALIARTGRDAVVRYMGHVQDNAEACVREVIGRLGSGRMRYEMDDGSAIEVAVTVDRERRSAVVDFAGTSTQRPGNFNAPFAVCTAAVLYVFRTLVNADFPLNEGCLRPLTIRVERGSMLNPVPPAAVVAGNVETSQCIVDALFGALGVLAASQGTMNNFTFGDAQPPVLRDHRRGLGRRAHVRRRIGRADAHDELAPHRSRSAREPPPRARARVPLPPRFGRGRSATAAATDSCAPSGSARR